MSFNTNDPFLGLLSNDKIDAKFWQDKAGAPSYGLQDDAVIALRKMGYNGSLGDMLFQYYTELTGGGSLMDAWAKLQQTQIRTETMDFIGKVRGDGDTSRQIYYGALGELAHPNGLNEAGSAMAGCSYEDDGQLAYYSISTPAGYKAQLIYHLDLTQYGTKAELLKYIKTLEVYQNAPLADIYVFDNVKGLWVKKINNGEGNKHTMDLSDNLEDYIANNGEVYIGYLAPVEAGTEQSRVEVDYFQLRLKLLK